VSYLKWAEPWKGHNRTTDTGLCNRIYHWELAYEINKLNNFKFTILVENHWWQELEYLDIPYTMGSDSWGVDFKKNTELFDSNELEKDNFKLDTSKNWYPTCGFDYSRFFWGKDELGIHHYATERPLKKIKVKDKFIADRIVLMRDNVVGIHIRRGVGVANKNLTIRDDRFYRYIEDKDYLDIMKKIVEINPNQKFYLSADIDKKKLGVYYDNFDIIDSTDVNPNLKDPHNAFKNYPKLKKKALQQKEYAKANVIDLFSLSYCSFLLTHVDSSWSEIATLYNRTPFVNVSTEKFNEESFIESMSD